MKLQNCFLCISVINSDLEHVFVCLFTVCNSFENLILTA